MAAVLAPDEGVTVVSPEGPGAFVNCVERSIGRSDPPLKVVSAASFPNSIARWDTENIVELLRILERPEAAAEVAAGNIRYVIILRRIATEDLADDDGALGLAECFVLSCPIESAHSATVWDVKQATKVAHADVTATGRGWFSPTSLILIPFAVQSDTETAACEALGRQLAGYFSGSADQPSR